MTEEEKEAIETMKRWIEYEKQNKDKINKANELIEIQETVLNLIQKKDKQIDLMTEYIDSNNYVDNEECQFQWDFNIKECKGNGDCKNCIKQNFEKKAE